MKIVKNPTNVQIVKELCKINPNSRYAKLVGYDETTGNINEDSLSLFASQPDISNEFISDMANKVIVQRAYDLFRDYKMPFGVFQREMSRLGDAEELLTAELATPTDYDETATPFSANKPSIVLAWIKTEDKKVVNVKLSYDIWAGAFTSEQGLSNIAGIILKNLRDSIELLVYKAIKTDLADATKVTKSATIQAVADAGETANAQKAYEQIIKLVTDMSLPNKLYNASEVETFTPLGRAVLVLNARYKSSFDVNVLASLFNSAKIGEKQYFSDVIVADLGENAIGCVLDEEAYLWGYRFQVSQSIVNPANLTMENYYHSWVKRAVVPFRQAVRLVAGA
jgi:hypothetical protein